ncbi:hypothetical protein M6B38_174690 [Iris pallida]|uniref:Uncharacterized protein n=1 Tax=Iris pallida TaxID=29817 RepID=A0AAX6ERQ5_IRIPA|nr:hypothetical protein M6B38_174690 [Iris pallida]
MWSMIGFGNTCNFAYWLDSTTNPGNYYGRTDEATRGDLAQVVEPAADQEV